MNLGKTEIDGQYFWLRPSDEYDINVYGKAQIVERQDWDGRPVIAIMQQFEPVDRTRLVNNFFLDMVDMALHIPTLRYSLWKKSWGYSSHARIRGATSQQVQNTLIARAVSGK